MQRRISAPQFARAVAKSAAWAGLTLIDPNSLTGWRKHTYWLAMAGVAGAEMATPAPADGEYRPLGLTTGMALSAAGLTYGAHELLARSDAWSMNQLKRLGIKHPRAWAAAGVFGLGMAAYLAEPSWQSPVVDDGLDEFGNPRPETLQALPDDVRAVIEELLGAVDGYGSEELHAQLDGVTCRIDESQVTLVADPEAPRTLLADYEFPATATFERNGLTHGLVLGVSEGAMAYLAHYVDPYPEDDSAVDWSLPSLEEVRIAVGHEDTAEAE